MSRSDESSVAGVVVVVLGVVVVSGRDIWVVCTNFVVKELFSSSFVVFCLVCGECIVDKAGTDATVVVADVVGSVVVGSIGGTGAESKFYNINIVINRYRPKKAV